MKTIVRNFVTRGRVFTIVKDQGMFLAIEDVYIDEAGCLTRSLNGCQMHAARELAMCLQLTADACWMDELLEQGYSRAEAFCLVNGLEMTKEIQALLNRAG